MEYQVQENCLTVYLPHELDHHNAEEIRKESDHLIEHNHVRYVIFDFADTDFMDSSGIGLVLGRYKRVRKWNGTLVVIPGSSYISRVLGLSGIFGMVPKSRNRSLALEYITARGGIRS